MLKMGVDAGDFQTGMTNLRSPEVTRQACRLDLAGSAVPECVHGAHPQHAGAEPCGLQRATRHQRHRMQRFQRHDRAYGNSDELAHGFHLRSGPSTLSTEAAGHLQTWSSQTAAQFKSCDRAIRSLCRHEGLESIGT